DGIAQRPQGRIGIANGGKAAQHIFRVMAEKMDESARPGDMPYSGGQHWAATLPRRPQSGERGVARAPTYMGGVKPSLPTARRAAFRLPSASLVAVTRSFAPTLASAFVPA